MGLPLKVVDFIGLFNFEWYSQNKVDNIGILVLWRDDEKLFRGTSLGFKSLLVQKLSNLNTYEMKTRMHSSRMRTSRTLTIFRWRTPPKIWRNPPQNLEEPPQKRHPPRKFGGTPLPKKTPPQKRPPLWTESQTPVKT